MAKTYESRTQDEASYDSYTTKVFTYTIHEEGNPQSCEWGEVTLHKEPVNSEIASVTVSAETEQDCILTAFDDEEIDAIEDADFDCPETIVAEAIRRQVQSWNDWAAEQDDTRRDDAEWNESR